MKWHFRIFSKNIYIHYKQKVKDIALIVQILGKYCKTTIGGHSLLQGFIADSEIQTKISKQCTTSMYWVSGSHYPYNRRLMSHRGCLLKLLSSSLFGKINF